MITEPKSHLEPEYLKNLAHKYRQEYSQGKPFPHIVIDDFLPESLLDLILKEFPDPQKIDWKQFENSAEKKLASSSELQMGDRTRELLYQLNSSTFVSFLEELTSIDGIIPDPHFVGGGLHQIERGGYLKIHADFNRHKKLRLDRRLNLLIYLNKDWQEEYGGHFEMWDTNMSRCEKKILPIFNRCVIFNTTDFSFHGHPEPLTCPENRTRKSLALYYYSNGRPAEEVTDGHSTIFRERPNEAFKADNNFRQKNQNTKNNITKSVFKKLLPPVFIDIKNYLSK